MRIRAGPIFDSAPYFNGGFHGSAIVAAAWDEMLTRGLGASQNTQACVGSALVIPVCVAKQCYHGYSRLSSRGFLPAAAALSLTVMLWRPK